MTGDATLQPGVSALDASTCLALLRTAEVGRLAITIGGEPDIFPINYLIDHGTVVFRTGEGTKLAAAVAHPRVAFEADGYEPASGEAWSVVVKGDAEEIKAVPEILDAMTFPLFPWHAGRKHRFLRIVPVDVSGRQFHVIDSETWSTPMTAAHHASPE